MHIVTSLPNAVREIENCWIPMPDGCRLAARVWLPETAEEVPVPAIFEYIPYRKRDGTRWRDEPMHRYFAGHGYASVRVDVRGSGESEGLLLDEYLEQELDDGVEAIRWIASRSWCTGAVGMMGKSWGGFNSLQVAARQPESLKAVISVCSTDDRYADDAHYMGGCLLNENLLWGSTLFTINARPPDPALVGERWREMWLERLENDLPFPELWLRHPRRDDYWKHGSVCEEFEKIACPVYAVGGWADAYTNAIPRLLAGLRCPRKGLVGPWAHLYPHDGVPGPAIGFLQEALRWWDQWLKGIDTGILDEPMYRAWMEEWSPPRPVAVERPGRWVAETCWPSPRIRLRRYALGPRGLELEGAPEKAPAAGTLRVCRSPETTGLSAGSWCSFGSPGDLPEGQREDDAKSLLFDSGPLSERLEIFGAPVLELALESDRPAAFVAVRLNDLAPDGVSRRVTYGILNLTRRSGFEDPEPLEPGRRYTARVKLNDVAFAFTTGHRLRVAISTAYWPIVWPSPEAATLVIDSSASFLELPIRPSRPEDSLLRPFERPESGPPLDAVDLRPGGVRRRIERDVVTGEVIYTVTRDVADDGSVSVSKVRPIDLEVGHAMVERFRIVEGDSLSARGEVLHTVSSRRGAWATRIATRTALSATRDSFRLEAHLEAYEGERLVFARDWERAVPRDLM